MITSLKRNILHNAGPYKVFKIHRKTLVLDSFLIKLNSCIIKKGPMVDSRFK